MTNKLPVFVTLGEGFRCLGQNWRRILPYMGALAIVLITVAAAGFLLGVGAVLVGKISHSATHSPWSMFFYALVLWLVYCAFDIPVSNSIQRLAVQGEEARFGFGYGREEWMSIWAMLRLLGSFLGIAVPLLFLMVLLGNGVERKVLPILVLLSLFPLSLIMCRLLVVLPAAANGISLSLWDSIKITQGNSWRLFGLFILPAILFGIAGQLVKFLMGDGVLGIFLFMLISMLSGIYRAVVFALAFKHLRHDPEVSLSDPGADALPDPAI